MLKYDSFNCVCVYIRNGRQKYANLKTQSNIWKICAGRDACTTSILNECGLKIILISFSLNL